MRKRDNVLVTNKSVGCEICHVASHSTVVQRVDYSSLVDQSVTREVQQAYRLLHRSDSLGVDHTLSFRGRGNVERDIIALLKNLLIGFYIVDFTREFQRVLNVQERVCTVYLHTESCGSVRNENSDSAQTDNAKFLAHDLWTYELALAFFNELTHLVALTLEGLYPLHGRGYLTRA